ncbi:MAG: C-terminal helicase domain-containing protein, partial [Actinomycetota bacterium]|nr:C-terminal helicase domain-containing protein [Actinomycetota bacterium]
LKGIACTIKAGGTGITLTRASKMIFCDLEWNPALNLQAEDRICRIGQTATNLQYIRLVSDHPMDLHVLNLLDEKTALIQGAVEAQCAQLESRDKGATTTIVQETRAERDARIEAAAKKLSVAKAQSKVSMNRSSWGSRMNGFSKTPVSPEIAVEIAEAVNHMQAICDGALSEDGAGFNKPDAAIMHTITESNLLSGDEDLLRFCWWTLRKYKGQLHTTYPKLYGDV